MHLKFHVKFKVIPILFIFLLLFAWNMEVLAEMDIQQMAPDFSLKDISSGKVITLKEHRGNIVLLDFWATWCVPCRKSIPELVRINDEYKDKGVVVLGITLDNPDSFDDKWVLDFAKQYKMNYPALRYNDKVVAVYLGTEDVRVPMLFIIDKNGMVQYKIVGYEPAAAERSLQILLSK